MVGSQSLRSEERSIGPRRLDRISLLYTPSCLDTALEFLLCIHSRRDCLLPRDLMQRRNQFRILSFQVLSLGGARVHTSRPLEWWLGRTLLPAAVLDPSGRAPHGGADDEAQVSRARPETFGPS